MRRTVFVVLLICLAVTCKRPPCKNNDYDRLANGKCYRLMKSPATYNSAKAGCRLTNGKLPSIHNYTDNTEIGVWSAGWSAPEVWIGLACTDDDLDTCAWLDGTDMDYTNFDDNPPDLDNGQCFYMEAGKVTLTLYNPWENADCGAKKMFICESILDEPDMSTVAPKTTTTRVRTTTTRPGVCRDYAFFNGQCYKLQPYPSSQPDAELVCRSEGGHLASIHNNATNTYIYNLLTSSNTVAAWIGLSIDNTRSPEYQWTDGTPVDFKNVPGDILVPLSGTFAMSAAAFISPSQWIPQTNSNLNLLSVCQRNV